MSTRTYNFRSRVGASEAPRASQALDDMSQTDSLEVANPSNEAEPLSEAQVPNTEATLAVPSYSDVVASRPPSPRRERPAVPSGGPGEDPDLTRVPHYSDVGNRMNTQFNTNVDIGDFRFENGGDTPAEEEAPWTTVQRRRTRSPIAFKVQKPLTSEQVQAVRRATEGMTDEQRQQVLRRQEKIQPRRGSSTSSRGEGPSRPKGKVIDPREWGNVNISQESLNIDAQAAALDSFKNQADNREHLAKPHRRRNRSRSASLNHSRRHASHQPAEQRGKRSSKRSRRPAETQPAAQIAPKSYLGTALRSVGHPRHPKPSSNPSDSPESSSSSYSSSSDSSSSTGTDTVTESSDESSTDSEQERSSKRRRDQRHGRNRKRQRRSAGHTIKPIPPKEYDGTADVRSYHRFVRESDAYLRDGKVRSRRKVFLLSYYLTGKAYDFYTQKVAIDEERWTVPQFYKELFNYCFPVDYRMQLRKTLARCHQNDKSVAEYTHELQDLFNMIGNISKH